MYICMFCLKFLIIRNGDRALKIFPFVSSWNSANFDKWTISVGQVVPEIPLPPHPQQQIRPVRKHWSISFHQVYFFLGFFQCFFQFFYFQCWTVRLRVTKFGRWMNHDEVRFDLEGQGHRSKVMVVRSINMIFSLYWPCLQPVWLIQVIV